MAKKDKDNLRPAVPQPTKRDMVIAQRQKQIAAGDTPLSIANQNNIPVEDLLGANPGVVTVRPGQVINIPRPPVVPGSTAVGNQSGYAMQGGGISTTNQYGAGITKTPYASRGTAGYYAAYNQANTGTIPQIQSYEQTAIGNNSGYVMQGGGISTTNQYGSNVTSYNGTAGYYGRTAPKTGGGKAMPSLVPVQNPYAGYTGTAGYWGGYNQQQSSPALAAARAATPSTAGYTNLTPSQSQNIPKSAGGISGDKQGTTGTTQQPAAMFPTDEKGKPIPYTGNPNDPNTALWKKYWDASARAGVDLAGRNLTAPTVMTRDQIWQMKADQRRRQAASMEQDGTAYNQSAYQYDTTGYGVGSPLVRNITWSIRG